MDNLIEQVFSISGNEVDNTFENKEQIMIQLICNYNLRISTSELYNLYKIILFQKQVYIASEKISKIDEDCEIIERGIMHFIDCYIRLEIDYTDRINFWSYDYYYDENNNSHFDGDNTCRYNDDHIEFNIQYLEYLLLYNQNLFEALVLFFNDEKNILKTQYAKYYMYKCYNDAKRLPKYIEDTKLLNIYKYTLPGFLIIYNLGIMCNSNKCFTNNYTCDSLAFMNQLLEYRQFDINILSETTLFNILKNKHSLIKRAIK